MSDLLNVTDLRVTFPIRRQGAMPWAKPDQLRAVNGVDFTLRPGETLGVDTANALDKNDTSSPVATSRTQMF